jgi:uncharacterized protein (TIGR00369 family)
VSDGAQAAAGPCLDAGLLRRHSGLELMRMLLEGVLPMAPIAATLGFRLVEVERGRVAFEGVPGVRVHNLHGTAHGGWAATLLDSAMGCAVLSVLPPGVGHTTTELSIRYVRPIGEATGPLRAEATILHAGRRLATAEGRLVGLACGRLYAHGQTSCMILPLGEDATPSAAPQRGGSRP